MPVTISQRRSPLTGQLEFVSLCASIFSCRTLPLLHLVLGASHFGRETACVRVGATGDWDFWSGIGLFLLGHTPSVFSERQQQGFETPVPVKEVMGPFPVNDHLPAGRLKVVELHV